MIKIKHPKRDEQIYPMFDQGTMILSDRERIGRCDPGTVIWLSPTDSPLATYMTSAGGYWMLASTCWVDRAKKLLRIG